MASITWDVQNRVLTAGGAEYGYNLGNQRIWRKVGWVERLMLYGASGERIAEYTVTVNGSNVTLGSQQAVWYWFAGKPVGPATSASGPPRDQVGSVISGTNGVGFYPYGEERSATANDKDKFATYYRDSATGLDYAMNRYYSATNGRFLSPDPYVASAGAGSPQSWNRYAYVENDPVNKLDPAGLATCYAVSFVMTAEGGSANIQCMSAGGTISRNAWISIPIGNPDNPTFFAYVIAIAESTLGLAVDAEEENTPECQVSLRFRPVDAVSGLANHAYISYEVTRGSVVGLRKKGVLEGQPEFNPPNWISVSFRLPFVGFPITVSVPDFGKLRIDESGAGVGNRIDRDPSTGPVLVGAWVCDRILKMMEAIKAYNTDPVRSWPDGPNSNGAARYILDAGGLLQYYRQPISTVGWDVPIRP